MAFSTAATLAYDAATCGNCYTTFENLPIEQDGDCGGSVSIPAMRCFYPGCQVKLCPHCPQFVCDGCNHGFCSEHRLNLDTLRLCPACVPDALECNQPICSCKQTNVYLFDGRGCPAHDPTSEWNVAKRAITNIERWEGMVA